MWSTRTELREVCKAKIPMTNGQDPAWPVELNPSALEVNDKQDVNDKEEETEVHGNESEETLHNNQNDDIDEVNKEADEIDLIPDENENENGKSNHELSMKSERSEMNGLPKLTSHASFKSVSCLKIDFLRLNTSY